MTLHLTNVESQSVKTTHSHGGTVPRNCQLNVSQNCEVSSGHANMPAEHLDVGFDSRSPPCFQLYPVGNLMGNRLADCAVGASASAAAESPQSVPAIVATGSYRDCSQWQPAQSNPAVLQHGKRTDWSPRQQLAPACDVNRPVWASQHAPAVCSVNGLGSTQSNYAASQAYAQQRCSSQIPRPFLPASIPVSRLPAGSFSVNIRPMLMQVRSPMQQQQQQVFGGPRQNSASLSPLQNRSVVGLNNASSPLTWPPRFASPSLTTARLPVPAAHVTAAAAATPCTSVESRLITDPACSPATCDSPIMRNNTVGRIYQLPVTTVAMTTGPCVSASTLVSSSESVVTPASVMTSAQSKSPVVRPAVITASQPEPYVTGRCYTVTKEDGGTFEGIWDGKYLTVLTTSLAKNKAQTSGESVWSVVYAMLSPAH